MPAGDSFFRAICGARVLSQKYFNTALLLLRWDVIGDSHRFPHYANHRFG
jgi:hypothetical protein